MECHKLNLEPFSLDTTFSWKTKGDWRNSCKHICRHKESTLTDYNSFQDLSGKFFHSKAIDFFNFLSPYKCRKSLAINTTLMSFNWIIWTRPGGKFTQPRTRRKAFNRCIKTPNFCTEKVHFKWTFFFSDRRKNKSDSRANLFFLTWNVLLNFRLEFEGNILFETTWNRFWIPCELFSALELFSEGASPCACNHSSTSSSKKNVLKAFSMSRYIINNPVNCRNMY